MRLLNVLPFKPGDRVDVFNQHGGGRWNTVTVEEIRVTTKSDWCFSGQLCVWWNGGGSRWPVTLCRKAEQ